MIQVTLIVGPRGTGKTTLAESIVGEDSLCDYYPERFGGSCGAATEYILADCVDYSVIRELLASDTRLCQVIRAPSVLVDMPHIVIVSETLTANDLFNMARAELSVNVIATAPAQTFGTAIVHPQTNRLLKRLNKQEEFFSCDTFDHGAYIRAQYTNTAEQEGAEVFETKIYKKVAEDRERSSKQMQRHGRPQQY